MYEFIYFLHFKYMNSYKYEFILCMNSYIFGSYHVGIHIFLQWKIKAASARKPQARAASARRERTPRARAASAQCELRAHSASREGKPRAHLLP